MTKRKVIENPLQTLTDPPGSKDLNVETIFDGLYNDNIDTLLKIVNPEYMDSNYFGHGKIPKLFYKICENRQQYQLHEVAIKSVTFYILIEKIRLASYAKLIELWSEKNYTDNTEYHGLNNIINKKEFRIKGWIDVDLNVLFFTDKTMAQKMDEFLHFES